MDLYSIPSWGNARVFVDSAGELRNATEDVIVLVASICYAKHSVELNARFKYIKDKASDLGVDVNREEFEFHTYELLNNDESRFFKHVPFENRLKILQLLRKAVTTSCISYAVIKIDKTRQGEKGLREFKADVDNERRNALNKVSADERYELEKAIKVMGSDDNGLGELKEIIGVLFGLTTGLMHREDFREKANLIVDKRFLKGEANWQVVFKISDISWPMISVMHGFPGWPVKDQPGWYFADNYMFDDSFKHFGLQLSDYIAYTTKVMHKPRAQKYPELTLFTEDNFKPFFAYHGISWTYFSYGSVRGTRRNFVPRKMRRGNFLAKRNQL